ncbi:hypothetical protein [Desulfitobacterium hafniense]|uniref:hypothetical protein n=1 Tax=Desulfitobacterium hafniense TaxID=49338 RepID=UPI00351FEE6A
MLDTSTSGQLGGGDTGDLYALTEVLLPEEVSEIGVGDDSSLALTLDGVFYTWGDNRSGSTVKSHFRHMEIVETYQLRRFGGLSTSELLQNV